MAPYALIVVLNSHSAGCMPTAHMCRMGLDYRYTWTIKRGLCNEGGWNVLIRQLDQNQGHIIKEVLTAYVYETRDDGNIVCARGRTGTSAGPLDDAIRSINSRESCE